MSKMRALSVAALFGLIPALAQAQVIVSIPNASGTGTTLNSLAKLTGAPSTAVLTATTDTTGAVGVVVSGAGTTGNALIARAGQATCNFDGATTAGDYVINSATVAGDCLDTGSAVFPSSGQVIGRVLSSIGSAGTAAINISGSDLFGVPPVSANAGFAISSNGAAAAPSYQNTVATSRSFVGYIASNWVPTSSYGSAITASAVSVAGTVYCKPFTVFPPGVTISHLAAAITTLDAGGNLNPAIYNNGSWGRPSTLAAATTAALSTASVTTVSATTSTTVGGGASNIAFVPGVYWACVQQDNTTSKYGADGNSGPGSAAFGGSATLADVLTIAAGLSAVSVTGAFGTLPTFTSGTTWTDLTSASPQGPTIAYQVVSSP